MTYSFCTYRAIRSNAIRSLKTCKTIQWRSSLSTGSVRSTCPCPAWYSARRQTGGALPRRFRVGRGRPARRAQGHHALGLGTGFRPTLSGRSARYRCALRGGRQRHDLGRHSGRHRLLPAPAAPQVRGGDGQPRGAAAGDAAASPGRPSSATGCSGSAWLSASACSRRATSPWKLFPASPGSGRRCRCAITSARPSGFHQPPGGRPFEAPESAAVTDARTRHLPDIDIPSFSHDREFAICRTPVNGNARVHGTSPLA